MSAGTVVMEGYLLKKKRKKMQGMARRFFRLAGNGQSGRVASLGRAVRGPVTRCLRLVPFCENDPR